MQHSFRTVARLASLAGAAALTVSLVACAGEPELTPTPIPDANAPVFETDEAAFAAAEDAYGRFLLAFREATSKKRATVALREVASGNALTYAEVDAQEFVDRAMFTVGAGDFEIRTNIDYFEDATRGAVVVIQLCEDISGVDVVNEAGESLVATDRVTRIPYQVTVEGDADNLLVSERDVWERDNFCL